MLHLQAQTGLVKPGRLVPGLPLRVPSTGSRANRASIKANAAAPVEAEPAVPEVRIVGVYAHRH